MHQSARAGRIARARAANASTARGTSAPLPASAHRFAEIAVEPGGDERTVERGPFPLRFGIARTEPFEAAPGAARTVGGDELLAWELNPPLDLIELRHATGETRVTGVKALDLALEAYRSAAGVERELAPLIDRFAALLRFDPAKHALHLELSGEPTKDQLEGLARLRDYAQKRARETGTELDLHIATPDGRPVLRPPKP